MNQRRFLPREGLQELFDLLRQQQYRIIGPREETVQGGLAFRELDSPADLPQGLHDEQLPGSYRLQRTDSPRCFAWSNTASAIKPFVFTPREKLWQVVRREGRLDFEAISGSARKTAIIGVRACDLAALAVQDAHFLRPPHADPYYRARREKLLLIAVNCTHPSASCFCASTGDGPVARSGYDLLLDELDAGFVIQSGSSAGAELLEALAAAGAGSAELAEVERAHAEARMAMKRALPAQELLATMGSRLEDARWTLIAQRCLSCGNCTAVCPTCFCHREFDVPELKGQRSEHWRDADSCFNGDHSAIVGEVVREGTRERYRQWMTHKLFNWVEQYGRSGCVGCGRCITWCPVGIDFVAEARYLTGLDQAPDLPVIHADGAEVAE